MNVLQYKDNLKSKCNVKRNSNNITDINYNINKKNIDNNTNKLNNNHEGRTVATIEISIEIIVTIFRVRRYKV